MANEHENNEDHKPRYEGGIPLLPGPEEREKDSREAEKKEEAEYKRRQESIQSRILWTQIGLVVFGVLGTIISAYQSHTAGISANQAQRSADTAACALRENQRQFKITSESAQKQFGQTLAQMQSQTSAQKKSAAEAQQAVAAAKEAMYLEQRPWVGVEIVAVPVPTDMIIKGNGQNITPSAVQIIVHNTGRTPALHWKESCLQYLDVSWDRSDDAVPTCEELTRRDDDRRAKERDNEIDVLTKILRRHNPDEAAARKAAEERVAEEQSTADKRNTGETLVPNDTRKVTDLMTLVDQTPRVHYALGAFTYRDVIVPTMEHVTYFCVMRVGASQWRLCPFGQEMK